MTAAVPTVDVSAMSEAAIAERLSVQEKLLLAQAVHKLGAANWPAVSKMLQQHPCCIDTDPEALTPRGCEQVYIALMTGIGINVPAPDAAKPGSKINLRLAQVFYVERTRELQAQIQRYEDQFKELTSDIAKIKAGEFDDSLRAEVREALTMHYGKKAMDAHFPSDEQLKSALEAGPPSAAELAGRASADSPGSTGPTPGTAAADAVIVVDDDTPQSSAAAEEAAVPDGPAVAEASSQEIKPAAKSTSEAAKPASAKSDPSEARTAPNAASVESGAASPGRRAEVMPARPRRGLRGKAAAETDSTSATADAADSGAVSVNDGMDIDEPAASEGKARQEGELHSRQEDKMSQQEEAAQRGEMSAAEERDHEDEDQADGRAMREEQEQQSEKGEQHDDEQQPDNADKQEAEVEADEAEPEPEPETSTRGRRASKRKADVQPKESPTSKRAASVSSNASGTPAARRSGRRGMREEATKKGARQMSEVSIKEEDVDDDDKRRGKRKGRDVEEASVEPERKTRRQSTRGVQRESVDNEAETPAETPAEPAAAPSGRRPRLSSPREQRATKTLLNALYESIHSHRNGNVFLNPVRKSDAPDYYDIVKRPMDLKTIKQRVKDGSITTVEEFQRDIRLINAMMYNRPGSEVYDMAKDMLAHSERSIATFKMVQDRPVQR